MNPTKPISIKTSPHKPYCCFNEMFKYTKDAKAVDH